MVMRSGNGLSRNRELQTLNDLDTLLIELKIKTTSYIIHNTTTKLLGIA